MSYLVRDELSTYDFRRVTPLEPRPVMPAPWAGKANWKLSFKTNSPAAAQQATFRAGRECMADFEAAAHARTRSRALLAGGASDVADADGSILRALHEEHREALQRSDTEIVVGPW